MGANSKAVVHDYRDNVRKQPEVDLSGPNTVRVIFRTEHTSFLEALKESVNRGDFQIDVNVVRLSVELTPRDLTKTEEYTRLHPEEKAKDLVLYFDDGMCLFHYLGNGNYYVADVDENGVDGSTFDRTEIEDWAKDTFREEARRNAVLNWAEDCLHLRAYSNG